MLLRRPASGRAFCGGLGMVRNICAWCCVLLLPACSGWGPAAGSWFGAESGRYDFDWQLSGDPAVAPLQVFDDGRRIWLQFAPGQAVPAIFAQTAAGEQPLVYVRRDPYVVLDGRWPQLVLRGGRLSAQARHGRAAPLAPQSGTGSVHESAGSAVAGAAPGFGSGPGLSFVPNRPSGAGSAAPERRLETVATLSASTASASASAPTLPGRPVEPSLGPLAQTAAPYRAGPPDDTLRAVLMRWADTAGWTFLAQHWALEVDIPLAGSAEFAGDFKTAVRALLAATELGERPLQPCFYANRVLRVVPMAQACDRSARRAGGAS